MCTANPWYTCGSHVADNTFGVSASICVPCKIEMFWHVTSLEQKLVFQVPPTLLPAMWSDLLRTLRSQHPVTTLRIIFGCNFTIWLFVKYASYIFPFYSVFITKNMNLTIFKFTYWCTSSKFHSDLVSRPGKQSHITWLFCWRQWLYIHPNFDEQQLCNLYCQYSSHVMCLNYHI